MSGTVVFEDAKLKAVELIAETVTLNNFSVSTSTSFQQTTNVSNATTNTVRFTNPTTAFVTTGNVEVGTANLFVDTTTSSVGIGTSSPRWGFEVTPSGGLGGVLSCSNDPIFSHNLYYSGGWKYGTASTGGAYMRMIDSEVQFWNAPNSGSGTWDTAGGTATTTQRMTIDESGNVGIGTTSPSYKLNISTDTNYDGISLRDSTRELLKISKGNNGAYINMFESGASKVNISTNGDSYLNGGNVGIGTASPRATLDVNSTDSIIIPAGTDAERNATPVKGMLRLNTTQNNMEYYYNNWIPLAPRQTNIITNGLVVKLDAADYTSYPTSGSTWYDLSGSGRNGTLQGSVTWQNNGSASYFDFPGANADYIKQTAGGSVIYKDICIVFNVDAMNTSFAYLISRSTTADKTLRVGSSIIGNPGNNGDWSSSSSSGITYYVNGVADTDAVSITNGEWYIIGGENTNSSLLSSAWNYYLGTGYTQGTRNLNGKIAFVALYNRVLTATEQIQNYNALRGRFGL